jgi:hypothetical protein
MKIKSNVAVSESGFVFNPSTGESYSINPIGIEIFNMIKESKTFEEISKEILAAYNTELDTFEKDYQDFVGFLKQYQLIENGDA